MKKKIALMILYVFIAASFVACDSQNNTSNTPSSQSADAEKADRKDEKSLYGKNALEIKASGEPLNNDELLRLYGDPDTYSKRPVQLSGTVIEANNRDEGYIIIQVEMSHDENPAIILLPEDAPFFKIDSYVAIDGIVLGSVEGEDEFGISGVWPTIVAKEITQS